MNDENKFLNGVPRIRGRIAQIEEPIEYKDQWCFEISLWTFDGETRIGDAFGPFGPFATETEATQEMNKAVRLVAEKIELSYGGEVSGKYIDLKNGGVLRNWEEH